MIYLYGVLEGANPPGADEFVETPGLQGPLQTAPIGRWTLVYSDQDDAEILPKRRLMLAHTRVLERMSGFGTVLPARFGLVAENLEKVTTLIGAKGPVIESEFDRVRGCVEIGIRVGFDRQHALEATLAEDAALRRERDALAKKGPEAHFAMAEFGGKLADRLDRCRGAAQGVLLQTLMPLCRAHVLRKPEEDTEVLRAEFLIAAETQDAFVAAVDTAARSVTFAPAAEPAIQVIGPVPMYNFVRLSLAFDPEEAAA